MRALCLFRRRPVAVAAFVLGVAALTVITTGNGTLAGNHDVNSVAAFMVTGWLVGVPVPDRCTTPPGPSVFPCA